MASAPASSQLDPDAPAFEPGVGVERSGVSSLAAGADRYEERMQSLVGADSQDVPPPGEWISSREEHMYRLLHKCM